MALGLLVEMAFFHRPLRMAAFALALVLTYSGTGLLALLIGIVFSVRPHDCRPLERPAGELAGLCAWAAGDVLNLSFTLNRIKNLAASKAVPTSAMSRPCVW